MTLDHKFAPTELGQIRKLVILIEGTAKIGEQHSFCNQNTVQQFISEKAKRLCLLSPSDTGFVRYITRQQLLALLEVIKIGRRLISIAYKKI